MNAYIPAFDFRSSHVQTDLMSEGKDFVSSESIILCAYSVNDTTTEGGLTIESLFPIGVVQNVGVQQQKQINQLYEIGSKMAYFIPGRTMIQIQLSRVLFNGDSLMAVLYANKVQNETDGNLMPGFADGQGSHRFYMNLASTFFNTPTNLAVLVVDSENNNTGAVLFKECYIQAHGFGMASNQTIVAENVSLRCQNIESVSAAGFGVTG